MSVSKARFRFNDEYDLYLCREVYGQNPFEDSKRWNLIQINMIQITGQSISVRTLRERMQNLIKKHNLKTRTLKGKSGIEISTSEIDDLLEQITTMMCLFENKKIKISNTPTKPDKSSYQEGFNIREVATSSININDSVIEEPSEEPEEIQLMDVTNFLEIESNGDSTEITVQNEIPSKKRPMIQTNILAPKRKKKSNLKEGTMQYLEKKHEKQYELKNKELALQERKQLLEERKFELDKEERQKRLEIEEKRLNMEEQRLKIEIELFSNQQEIINLLLKKQ